MSKVKTITSNENIIQKKEADTKIDAIKQLIFGENMRAYDSEFESVKKDLLSKKKELEVLIDDVRNELFQSVDNLSTDLNIRITEIEDKLNSKINSIENKNVDRKLLGELFTKLGDKINQ